MNEDFIRKRITTLRVARNISEYKISADLGFSKGYVQSITSGRSLPSLPALLDICDYFDITPKDFFDEEIEPESPLVLKILKNLKDLPEEELSEILNITEKYQFHKLLKERMTVRRK
ncbi:MAG: helix-turn-helix domain-containing protein [Lachnospiraceae bacterium]|jgi:transcriptional regulator with XRE-family HTH domain